MDYSKLTLGELLSSENLAIRRNATGILKQLQKQDLYYTYNNEKDYENYVRKTGKPHDNVIVKNILFTMDEYDMNGQSITYGNLKKKKMMTITTKDRYKLGFSDAIIEIDDLISWRNDICYLE